MDTVAPARLGKDFRWLLGSSWLTNLGDGIAIAAGPLLIASQTRDPVLVSMALLVQWLPGLVFGLYAGVIADRLDRRRLVVGVNLARAVCLGILAWLIWTDQLNASIVLVALFVIAVAETFADTTTSTLLPMMVKKPDLGVANARITAGYVTANQMAGPSLGALLFAAGAALPFVGHAVLMVFGAMLVSRIAGGSTATTTPTGRMASDVADGIRWLWRHPPLRTLSVTILAFNVTFAAAWSVLVLYAGDRLGLDEVGFGALITVMAVGGLVGTLAYGWLERRFSLANIMRVGFLIETLTHLALATTTRAWVAGATLFLFGAHAFVWETTSTTVRHRAVPTEFQGRVGSVQMLSSRAGLVIGAVLGGAIAARWGVTAPFWFAFAGSVLILVSVWRELIHIAHSGE